MAREWYILHTFSGYENKIEQTIRTQIANGTIADGIIHDIKVPEEVITEMKGGKKRTIKRKFLPGYILIEMDLPDFQWKGFCNTVRSINGVTGFLGTAGNAKPQPISSAEAKRILQKTGEIKGEKASYTTQIFSVGQQVKIIDGPFASFTGTVEEVMADKNKLKVMVTIFGRTTPVELEMLQAESL